MKISFEQLDNRELNADKSRSKASAYTAKSTASFNSAVSFGKDESNSSAYGFKAGRQTEKQKNLNERLADIDNYDANTAHKYMAVMSNTMSQDDFTKLQEEGYNPCKMPVGEAITNLDRIKVVLARAGKNIPGYTDDIDISKAAEITGSVTTASRMIHQDADLTSENISFSTNTINADITEKDIIDSLESADLPANEYNISEVKNALAEAHEIKDLSDSAILYMTRNELEPTIQNVYEAQYASGINLPKSGGKYFEADNTGYLVTGAQNTDVEGIKEQIVSLLERAGIEVNDDAIRDAQWLVQNAVPLTDVTLKAYEDMKSVAMPLDDSVLLPEITEALANGRPAADAYLIRGYRQIKNARIMEETRLAMTHEANRSMLESDYQLDTSELTGKVDALKAREKVFYKAAFGQNPKDTEAVDKNTEIFEKTLESIDEIKTLPLEVLGRFDSAEEFTLEDIKTEGRPIKARYEAAKATYEAVGTEVRKDLGDNIRTAFRNVDDILSDMGYELTTDNRRAVRILGYNSMDITDENISKVRTLDIEVRNVIEKMTPGRTLQLIKEQKNPLEMSISELSETLDSSDDQDSTKGYARFLLQLEKNNEISKDEAESYIGIYRLMHAIEKSDGAIIGSMLNSERDMTVKNLLGELRSRRRQGKMDYLVDDDTDGLSSISKTEDFKIDTQIGAAFNYDYTRDAAKEVYEKLDANVLHESKISENTTLYEILDILRSDEKNAKEINEAEYRAAAKEIRDAANADEKIYQLLDNFKISLTSDNINAMKSIIEDRLHVYAEIYEKASINGKKKLEEKIERLYELFDSEKSVKDAYEDFADIAEKTIDNEIYETDSYIDLKAMQNTQKQLSIAKQLAKEEYYEIPILTAGHLSSINLRMIHEDGAGKVEVSMETEKLGKIYASFTIKDDSAEGIIVAKEHESSLIWNRLKENVSAGLSESGLAVRSISVIENRIVKDKIFDDSMKNTDEQRTDSKLLYKAAKVFISVVREAENEN